MTSLWWLEKQELAAVLDKIKASFQAFNMKINKRKTKILVDVEIVETLIVRWKNCGWKT